MAVKTDITETHVLFSVRRTVYHAILLQEFVILVLKVNTVAIVNLIAVKTAILHREISKPA